MMLPKVSHRAHTYLYRDDSPGTRRKSGEPCQSAGHLAATSGTDLEKMGEPADGLPFNLQAPGEVTNLVLSL